MAPRHHTLRSVFSSGIGFMLCARIFVGVAWAGEAYDVVFLDPFHTDLGIYESYAFDVNDSGEVCGMATADGSYSGFLRLGTGEFLRFPISLLRGINPSGLVVGHNLLINPSTGEQTIIPGLSETFARVWLQAVNDENVVVGYAEWRNNEEGTAQMALVWDSVNGTRDTGVPGATELVAINNAGIAVGNVRYSTGSSEALVYNVWTRQATNLDDLLTPDPTAPGWSTATYVNDNGFVVGEGWNGTNTAAFVWSPSTGFTFLEGLKGGETARVHPMGISADNTVVGYALTATMGWRAFVWNAVDGMRDLNDCVMATGGFVFERALRISPNGVIVGDGAFQGAGRDPFVAFMLTPQSRTITSTGESPVPRMPRMTASPNPFNPTTTIHYTLPEAMPRVRIDVYRVTGEHVRMLVSGAMGAGDHTTTWDGRDDQGNPASSGVYFVRLTGGVHRVEQKIVLLK